MYTGMFKGGLPYGKGTMCTDGKCLAGKYDSNNKPISKGPPIVYVKLTPTVQSLYGKMSKLPTIDSSTTPAKK